MTCTGDPVSLRFAPVYMWPNGARLVRPLDVATFAQIEDLGGEVGRKVVPTWIKAEDMWEVRAILALYDKRIGGNAPKLIGTVEILSNRAPPVLHSYSIKAFCNATGYLADVLVGYLEKGLVVASPLMGRKRAGQLAPIALESIAQLGLDFGHPVVQTPVYDMLGVALPWLDGNEVFVAWWEEIGLPVWSP